MGALESKLNWSTEAEDGSARSMGAKIIDPVGACIQPAALSTFNPDDVPAAADAAEAAVETTEAPKQA